MTTLALQTRCPDGTHITTRPRGRNPEGPRVVLRQADTHRARVRAHLIDHGLVRLTATRWARAELEG